MNIDLIKAKVLDLAIKGQLVEQRDDEKLSDEILSLPNIEGPFEIPNNWKWININKVTNKGLQKKPNKDFIYIDVSSIDNKTGKIINRKLLKPSNAPSRARKIVSSGAILYSMVRPYLKNICVVQNINEETIASTAFAVLNCKNNIVNTFLYRVLLSSYFNQYVSSKQKGISYPAISESDFLNAPIPYPPLKEQNRIVKKVEEIFSILDALKDHQTSLLSKLDLIKKVAIDKAIKGQLVEQREDEKLSDEILTLPNIEGPFELPKNWKWIKAEYLIDVISGTSYKKEDITNKTEATSIRIIRGGNIQNGKIYFLDDDIFVKNYLKNHESTIQSKDIVIVASTGSKTVIGKAGLIIDNLIGDHSVQIGAFLRIIRPKHTATSRYLKLFYLTDYYRNIISHSVSGTNINNIKKSHIIDMLIPYPPLQEQNRIVQKLEEILSTVSTIENLLKSDKT